MIRLDNLNLECFVHSFRYMLTLEQIILKGNHPNKDNNFKISFVGSDRNCDHTTSLHLIYD
jgi:hypothetical protein